MSRKIRVYTDIGANILTEKELAALASLKNCFDWFHGGFRDNFVVFEFDIDKVTNVRLESSESLFKREKLTP